MRSENRKNDELRPVFIEEDVQPAADASLLIKMGNTHVMCAVTVEEKVPFFLRDTGKGWITAEYGMLPCSASSRMNREAVRGRSGRTYEIQRLIGRSLRMMVDLDKLGERTFRVDCDVIRADGGTRTASITGAALALNKAIAQLYEKGMLELPVINPVAAISVGMVTGQAMLDLDYSEDSTADADGNFVMSGDGGFIEVQCTAEGKPVTADEFAQMTLLARKGISELLALWSSEK